jgi:pseudaminic acid synthase
VSFNDIELVVKSNRKVGNNEIALLKCTSSYPAPIEEANIAMISGLAQRFNVVSGLSDHTIGSTVPIVVTALGAKIIEKHFILDRSIGGPDASFSMNEQEFTEMVKMVREAEKSVGSINYELTPKQKDGRQFCRSLYVVKDIKKGEVITEEHIRSIRPGFGIHSKELKNLIGQLAERDYEFGERF